MPSDLPYIAWGFIRLHFPMYLHIHLDVYGQGQTCNHAIMVMQWLVCSYAYLADCFPSFFLGWIHHGIPCGWSTAFHLQTWGTYHACFWCRSGLLCLYVAAVWHTSQIIPLVLYSFSWSSRSRQCIHLVTSRPVAWMACIFFLRLPERPFLGLVVKADSRPLTFLPWLSWLASTLVVIL